MNSLKYPCLTTVKKRLKQYVKSTDRSVVLHGGILRNGELHKTPINV